MTTEARPATRAEAVTAALESMISNVAESLREEIGGDHDFEALARKALRECGIVDEPGVKMWDPLAVVAIKSELVAVVVPGEAVAVLRPDPTDPSVIERPGNTHEIAWGDSGHPPKFVTRLTVRKVTPPEGRKA